MRDVTHEELVNKYIRNASSEEARAYALEILGERFIDETSGLGKAVRGGLRKGGVSKGKVDDRVQDVWEKVQDPIATSEEKIGNVSAWCYKAAWRIAIDKYREKNTDKRGNDPDKVDIGNHPGAPEGGEESQDAGISRHVYEQRDPSWSLGQAPDDPSDVFFGKEVLDRLEKDFKQAGLPKGVRTLYRELLSRVSEVGTTREKLRIIEDALAAEASSNENLAATTGRPVGTIKNYKTEMRKRMRKVLDDMR